jgi:hypothetical protein
MRRFLIERKFSCKPNYITDVKLGIHFRTDGFFGKKEIIFKFIVVLSSFLIIPIVSFIIKLLLFCSTIG